MMWAKRWTGYLGDTAVDAGVGWFAAFPFWRMPLRFWWRYPAELSFWPWPSRGWRLTLRPWPLTVFFGTYRSSRALRGLTPTKIKWRVWMAMREMAEEQQRKDGGA